MASQIPELVEQLAHQILVLTGHTHNPVDDAKGNAEALKRIRELGLRI